MAAKHKYYDAQGREIDEEDALTEEGIIKDGVSVRTPVTLRDSLGRRLVDAAGQSLSDFPARRSGYVFVDADRTIREENRELAKARLSAEWRGGLQQGDHVTLGGTRFEVLGYNSEDRMVLSDASGVDPDELKRQAYNDGVAAMCEAWRMRPTTDVEEVFSTTKDIDADDERSVDAQALKDAAWLEGVERLQNAWRR